MYYCQHVSLATALGLGLLIVGALCQF